MEHKNVIIGYDIDDPAQKQELIRYLAEEYQAGRSMKEALEVPEELLENVYSVAYQKYQAGEYKKAADIFRYLLTFDDRCYKYLLGLAACLHRMHDYATAAHLYLIAALYCPEDPVPYFHGGDCFLHTGELEKALAALEVAIQLSTRDEKFKELGERAKLIKVNISDKIKKT